MHLGAGRGKLQPQNNFMSTRGALCTSSQKVKTSMRITLASAMACKSWQFQRSRPKCREELHQSWPGRRRRAGRDSREPLRTNSPPRGLKSSCSQNMRKEHPSRALKLLDYGMTVLKADTTLPRLAQCLRCSTTIMSLIQESEGVAANRKRLTLIT